MATSAPHSTQPLSSLSLSPEPERVTHSNTEPGFSGSSPNLDHIPLTERGVRRSGSPTPSEKQELKQLDGLIKKMFRKESWKDKNFIGK